MASPKSPEPVFFRSLRPDETGSIAIFGLFLAILVLGITGFAVDMMRVESQRARVQGAIDTAVLAAADVDQKGAPAQVVKDYMAAAGLAGALDGEPVVGTGVRTVTAQTRLTAAPMFRMFNKPFTLVNSAVAANNTPRIEVSLVLDISQSMASSGTDAYGYPIGKSRIAAMREAAAGFVDTLMGSASSSVSISLVPFSEQVNVGPTILSAMTIDVDKPQRRHSNSYCVDMPDSEFDTVAVDTAKNMRQTQHVQTHSSYSRYPATDVSTPICPIAPAEVMLPISNDPAELKRNINALQPTNNTVIQYGVKWGAVMLDPSIAATITPDLSEAMKGRPLAYNSGSKKILVLLSDGENSTSQRIHDDFYDQDTPVRQRYWDWSYFSYRWRTLYVVNREYWETHNFDYWNNTDGPRTGYSNRTYYTADYYFSNDQLSRICAAARAKGIEIYGVGVQMPRAGVGPMLDCVTSNAHYYDVSDDEIDQAFQSIALDTVKLRLTR